MIKEARPISITPKEKADFQQHGFFQLRGFLDKNDVNYYLERVNHVLGLAKNHHLISTADKVTHTMADGVTKNSQLWPLIFDPQLLKTVRYLVGEDIKYTQHSDIHVNLPAGRWHRDNAHRNFAQGPDWKSDTETYGVVRIAIYLSSFTSSGSSLLVLPGSHRKETFVNRQEYVLWNHLRSLARKKQMNEIVPHTFFSRRYLRLKTIPGDCIIFDQRLMHAGGRLRGLLPKYAIYMSYGLNNSHAINHRDFFLSRPTYSKNLHPSLKEKLGQEALLLPQC